ncbi:right-handed parallel beta-helix repeat-containing protein [Actinomyces bowdenii]|uniref:Copper-binding protein n=1 Tax=Actinomyces bowdenii TaxID=131109 RepID=A0A3P1V689_9ACTO|nr:NosD domain-containing protein [Actinomyces bowdenii]RRD29328.1 copper-binding protein [Actinomyces bowdenii]
MRTHSPFILTSRITSGPAAGSSRLLAVAATGALSLALSACQLGPSHASDQAQPSPSASAAQTAGAEESAEEIPLVIPAEPTQSALGRGAGQDAADPVPPAPQAGAGSGQAPEAAGPVPSAGAAGPAAPADSPQGPGAPDPGAAAPSQAPGAPEQAVPSPEAPAAPVSPSLEEYLASQSLTEAHANGQVQIVSSLQEARDTGATAPHIVVSDGTSHIHFQQDRAQGADTTATIGGRTYGAVFTDVVPLLAFDVSGDATQVLTEAVATAARRGVGVRLSPTQAYPLTASLRIPDEVPFLDGAGATLDVSIAGTSQAKPGIAISLATGSSGTTVTGMTLDLADSPYTIGLQGDALSDSTISGITMTGVTFRGIQLAASSGPMTGVRITDNRIDNVEGSQDTKGVAYSLLVTTAMDDPDNRFAGSRSPIWERYVADGTVSPNRYANSGLTISGNTISGGYYGIGLSGVTDSVVSNNSVSSNMRSISMQNNCSNNRVESNTLTNSRSSAVHLAYNSGGNTVHGNTVTSERATGQGLLQAYQGSRSNTFSDNTVTLTGSSAPAWVLYVGPDSSGTTFTGNTVTGSAAKALIGIESIWDGRSADGSAASYMAGGSIPSPVDGSPVTYNGGRGALDQVTVTGNVLRPGAAGVPVVYVGAEVSAGPDGKQALIGSITSLNVSGNQVIGADAARLITTHTGSLPGVGTATITGDASVGSVQAG